MATPIKSNGKRAAASRTTSATPTKKAKSTSPEPEPERKKRAPRTELEKQELFKLDADIYFSLLVVKPEGGKQLEEPELSYKARFDFWATLCEEFEDTKYVWNPELCAAIDAELGTRRRRLEMPWYIPGCEAYTRTWYPDAWLYYEDTTPCFWNLSKEEMTAAVAADASELEAISMTVLSLLAEEKRASEIVAKREKDKRPYEMEVERCKRELELAKKEVADAQKHAREHEKWINEARRKETEVKEMRELLEKRLEELANAKKILEGIKGLKKET